MPGTFRASPRKSRPGRTKGLFRVPRDRDGEGLRPKLSICAVNLYIGGIPVPSGPGLSEAIREQEAELALLSRTDHFGVGLAWGLGIYGAPRPLTLLALEQRAGQIERNAAFGLVFQGEDNRRSHLIAVPISHQCEVLGRTVRATDQAAPYEDEGKNEEET